MIENAGFDPIIGALNTSLNLRLHNQGVISSNIANADTPGYKAKTMDFETALRDAIGADNGLKVEGAKKRMTDPTNPEIYDDPDGVEGLDGNTVDRAREMARMAENQLMYDASAEMLRRKLGMLKYAITEGGGGR